MPSLSLGTVSPVVAKLAVDRLKSYKRTGTAIGQVYAWGMVGSILGTFLTGFFLIDVFGTKGVILLIGTTMAFGATLLGSVWHAVWAGIPLGLCVLAFTPPGVIDVVGKAFPFVNGESFAKIGERWGIREQPGNPDINKSEFVWVDESNYYYIKVENQFEGSGDTEKRTLVLDNLIHGYFILNHPERLDYEYEHIYALVAYRAAKASGNVIFKPASATARPSVVKPLNLPRPDSGDSHDQAPPPTAAPKATEPVSKDAQPHEKTDAVKPAVSQKPTDGLKSVQATGDDVKESKKQKPTADDGKEKKDSFSKNPIAETPRDQTEMDDEELGSPVPAVEKSSMKTLFLGGGAYCFQRHMQFAYPGTGVDVAEIDPAVTRGQFPWRPASRTRIRSRPTGATPASLSSSTRTASNMTWSSATRSTTSRFPGTSPRENSTRRSRKC